MVKEFAFHYNPFVVNAAPGELMPVPSEDPHQPPISWYEEAARRGQSEEVRREGLRDVVALLREMRPATWLDFGCSAGQLLELASDVGEGCGYEIDQVAVDAGRERGLTIHSDWSDVPRTACILVVDVVEHMTPEELVEWLRRWHERLESGGHLIVATANPESWVAMMYFWDDWSHVRPYAEACLSALAGLCGFERERVVWSQMRTARRPVFRLFRKIMQRLGLWPELGSDFAAYIAVYRKA